MKRTISILRHAKAAEADSSARDVERPLSERGRQDAAKMGAYLAAQNMLPDLIFCSTAVRTRETLAQLGVTIPVILLDKLYLASAGEMLAQLQQTDDMVRHVMVIGHNPGAHELVVRLMEDAEQEEDIVRLATKFPTCALAQLSFNLGYWSELTLTSGMLQHYLIGKELPEVKNKKSA